VKAEDEMITELKQAILQKGITWHLAWFKRQIHLPLTEKTAKKTSYRRTA